MNTDTILAIGGLVFSSGGVTLIIFLLRRRPEIRGLDATSGSEALTSANEYIKTLQAGEKAVRLELDALNVSMKVVQTQLVAERQAATDALSNSQREIGRLSAELARVRTDLAVTQAEMAELTRRGIIGGVT